MSKNSFQKIILVGVAILICLGSSFFLQKSDELKEIEVLEDDVQKEKVVQIIKISITGAVVKPGMYDVPKGTRAEEAIAQAGGLTEEADLEKFNPARICRDGMQIRVAKLSKGKTNVKNNSPGNNVLQGAVKVSNEQVQKNSLVNLNTATLSELESLPGIGSSTAKKILENRPYSSIADIQKVKGIGSAKFEKMKSFLRV